MKYIKQKCRLDWRILLVHFKYKQYIWRFYPNLKRNPKLDIVSNKLEFDPETNSVPKNIIFIVGLINTLTCFNHRVRYYLYILHWSQKLFLYYNRYYRYLANEKKFGKKTLFKKKHGHKVHLIACIYHRQLTGIRMEKNHLRYWILEWNYVYLLQ